MLVDAEKVKEKLAKMLEDSGQMMWATIIRQADLSECGEAMIGSDRYAVEQVCDGCGKALLPENAWMEDGCPCNAPAGVNNHNLYRWNLLHDLQQSGARKVESLSAQVEELKHDAAQLLELTRRHYCVIVTGEDHGNLRIPIYQVACDGDWVAQAIRQEHERALRAETQLAELRAAQLST